MQMLGDQSIQSPHIRRIIVALAKEVIACSRGYLEAALTFRFDDSFMFGSASRSSGPTQA